MRTNSRTIVATIGIGLVLLVGILLVTGSGSSTSSVRKFPSHTPKPSRTIILPAKGTPSTSTPTHTPTLTATSTLIPTDTLVPTDTPTLVDTVLPTDTSQPSDVPTPTNTAVATPTLIPTTVPPSNVAPYPSAPLCAEHDNSTFHGLWNYAEGCHYDHEHGVNPFESEVLDLFPDIDLRELLGGVEIGHTNPSSPIENVAKHGGFKWQVGITPQGCVVGFEGAVYCVEAYAIQMHEFGDANHELGSRIHSAAALLRVCDPSNPNLDDCGEMYVVQHIDYGQRISPYQGDILPYPNQPVPSFPSGLGPYLTTDCVGLKNAGLLGACRSSMNQIRSLKLNTNSIWTSKNTGNVPCIGSCLFKLLFRVRDTYQVLQWGADGSIPSYPFTFLYVCGEAVYNPVGCRYNNSTATIHEISGVVPASWDNLNGFDTNPAVGRITAEGYVTKYGVLNTNCSAPSVSDDCFPIKMVNMYVGLYGSELSAAKVSNPNPVDTPERDIYFCNGVVCSETSPNAVPSGWIGSEN